MKCFTLAGLLLTASTAHADVMPVSSNDEPRIGLIHSENGGAIQLQVASGMDMTVLFPRGEQISHVTLNDTSIWHASVSGARDAVTLSTLRASNASGMSVQTNRRTYEFMLSGTLSAVPFYLVRLDGANGLGNRPRVWTPPVVVQPGTYRLSGKKELYPSSIRDDGSKIYLQWPSSQPLPAVFALNRFGREEMVDGYMREGSFTLDRLYDELVFRIDKAEAHARRVTGKNKP